MIIASQARVDELISTSSDEELKEAYNIFIADLEKELLGIQETLSKNNELLTKIMNKWE